MSVWWEAALVATALASAVAATGWVTTSGALAGAGLTFVFTGRGGIPALVGFALLVIIGLTATRVGYARKSALGVAQGDGARRRAVHALANAGPAALLLFIGAPNPLFSIAALASLAAAMSDTVSSEIGLLSPEIPRFLLMGRPAARGENGAMTWLGTAAGIAAAVLAAFVAKSTLEREDVFLPIIAGAMLGNFFDSVLGATLEPRLPVRFGNEIVNALGAAFGGLVALAFVALRGA